MHGTYNNDNNNNGKKPDETHLGQNGCGVRDAGDRRDHRRGDRRDQRRELGSRRRRLQLGDEGERLRRGRRFGRRCRRGARQAEENAEEDLQAIMSRLREATCIEIGKLGRPARARGKWVYVTQISSAGTAWRTDFR